VLFSDAPSPGLLERAWFGAPFFVDTPNDIPNFNREAAQHPDT
jgi:hypothetical protein